MLLEHLLGKRVQIEKLIPKRFVMLLDLDTTHIMMKLLWMRIGLLKFLMKMIKDLEK